MVVQKKQSVLLIKNGNARFRALVSLLRESGFSIDTTGGPEEAARIVRNSGYRAVIADLTIPGLDGVGLLRSARAAAPEARVIFIGSSREEASARKLVDDGAAGYFISPFDSEAVLSVVNSGDNGSSGHCGFPTFCGIVGKSSAVRSLIELIQKVADTMSTVLISGESGSGKELVAKAVHGQSRRAQNAFVVVHCGAIPETLLESELFGHERGAFTGAYTNKEGLFQSARGGTVFLDEIGEVSFAMQVKLLRVLESGVVRPVGSVRDTEVNVRVIAATNRDLRELVERGVFREDLFYRLNVFPIRVPALRERKEDIPLLTRYFLHRVREERSDRAIEISQPAMHLLQEYSWPGNVRELENVIERAAILSGCGPICEEHLPREVQTASAKPVARGIYELPFRSARDTFERTYLEQILDRCEGNVARAARTAEMSRSYFYEIIRKYGVSPR